MARGVTVIDGNLLGSGVTFRHSEGKDSVLAGFTVTHGKSYSGGGGVDCQAPPLDPRLHHLRQHRPSTAWRRGGVLEADPTIRDCIISNNCVDVLGGGISAYMSDAIIENNVITRNSAPWGGGIFATLRLCANDPSATHHREHAFKRWLRRWWIYCWDGSRASIVANRIENNSSDLGGASPSMAASRGDRQHHLGQSSSALWRRWDLHDLAVE
jgi:hypothetical protein